MKFPRTSSIRTEPNAMPINVKCRCGQSFAAKDELAGKTVKCPKCQAPLVIPQAASPKIAPATLNDLLDQEGFGHHVGIRCTKCNEPIPPGGMICLECGHNVQTGVTIATEVQQRKKHAGGHGEAAETILSRAAAELKKSPPPKDETASGMMVSYLLTIGMFVVTGAVAAGGFFLFRSLEGSEEKSYMSGFAMFWIGVGITSLGWIWIVVVAFLDNLLTGVFCLVIPFYQFYYGIVKGYRFQLFLITLGFIMSMGGLGLMSIASGGDPSKPIG